MQGEIRLRRWVPFRAVKLHVPPRGYVWAAKAKLGRVPISGFDCYADGGGEMRWRVLGRFPVMSAAGSDLDRSAAGRVALDAVFVPTAFLRHGVAWHSGEDADAAVATWRVGNDTMPVTMMIGADGGLRSVTMLRRGNPNGRPWGNYPCGGTVEAERTFGGITIPAQVRAGWFYGTREWGEGEFFRATITNATFL